MHLVLRLTGPPQQLRTGVDDSAPATIAGPVFGGARSSYSAKDLEGTVVSVGAALRPGPGNVLLGVNVAITVSAAASLPMLRSTHHWSDLERYTTGRPNDCIYLEPARFGHFV